MLTWLSSAPYCKGHLLPNAADYDVDIIVEINIEGLHAITARSPFFNLGADVFAFQVIPPFKEGILIKNQFSRLSSISWQLIKITFSNN